MKVVFGSVGGFWVVCIVQRFLGLYVVFGAVPPMETLSSGHGDSLQGDGGSLLGDSRLQTSLPTEVWSRMKVYPHF